MAQTHNVKNAADYAEIPLASGLAKQNRAGYFLTWPELFDSAMTDMDMANVNAYFTSRYSQKESAQAFDIYYATVSRILKTKAALPAHD